MKKIKEKNLLQKPKFQNLKQNPEQKILSGSWEICVWYLRNL